jgi:hypothetical protein
MIVLIAAVYIGIAVSDGRTNVIVGREHDRHGALRRRRCRDHSDCLDPGVLHLAHGAKDLWQHRHHFVRETRWWPTFCFAVDVTVASIVATQIILGVNVHV